MVVWSDRATVRYQVAKKVQWSVVTSVCIKAAMKGTTIKVTILPTDSATTHKAYNAVHDATDL